MSGKGAAVNEHANDKRTAEPEEEQKRVLAMNPREFYADQMNRIVYRQDKGTLPDGAFDTLMRNLQRDLARELQQLGELLQRARELVQLQAMDEETKEKGGGGKKSRRKKTKRRHKTGGKKSRKRTTKRTTIKGGKRKRRRTRRRR